MKKQYLIILAAACMILSTGCNRLDIAGMVVNRSDTEERVADWLDYNAQNGEPVIENAPDEYHIYSCSDSHYSERDNIVPQGEKDRLYKYITAERNDPMAVFAIHAGDMVNESGETGFIMTEAALQYNAETQAEDDPCFLVIGNHDVYYDCAKFFKQHFHTSTYTVTVKTVSGFKDLYIFLDSGNGTHGKRQLEWLEEKLSHREDYRHCMVISHNWLFRTSYNYTTTPAANLPQDEQYAFMDLMSNNNVEMVIMGHFHMREQRQFGGVQYLMTDNLNDGKVTPSYLVLTVGEKVKYEYEELDME
ncbi:MAG: metallophosphoesterase [Bacteroidales bacterium]|nr:metallophosphoesterase [Bacteroidales bacterium]